MLKVTAKTVDPVLLESLQVGSFRKHLYARPLRVAPQGRLGVLFDGRVRPLFFDESGRLVIVESLESYDIRSCSDVEIGLSFSVVCAFSPAQQTLGQTAFAWEIQTDQFGNYIYLTAPDQVVESLVCSLVEDAKYRVISWDSTTSDPDTAAQYDWYIQLSSGLSSTAIGNFIAKFAANTKIPEPDIPGTSPEAEAKLGELEQRIALLSDTKDSKDAEIRALTRDLKDAYLEVSRLSALTTNGKGVDEDDLSVRAKDLKRTSAERIIAYLLCTVYPCLAFSPDSPKLISTRLVESKSLWPLLAKLNRGQQVKKVALHGVPGRVGWFEVARHIATGKDSRGRAYIRDAKGTHRYDIVLHWKQNEAEQNRLIRQLANYSAFPGPEIVLGK